MDGELDCEHRESKRRHDGEHQDFAPWLDAQSPHGEERDDYQGGDERHRDHPERWRHTDQDLFDRAYAYIKQYY